MGDLLSSVGKLRNIGRAADPKFDRRLVALFLGSLVAGLSELLSIGSVLPLLLLANGGRSAAVLNISPLIGGDIRTWAMLFAALVAMTAALRMWLAQFSQQQVLEVGSEVSIAVHARVLEQPYSYHVQHHSSALIALIGKVDQLVFGVGWPLVQAIAAAIVGAAIMTLLIGLQPLATLVACAAVGSFYILISHILTRRLRTHGEAASTAYQQQVRLLQDSVGAIRDLLVERRQSYFVEAFAKASRVIVAARRGTDMLGNAPRFLIEAVGMIVFAGFTLVLADRAGGLGSAIPILAVFALAVVRLLPLAHQLFRGWANVTAERAVIDEVAALLALPKAPRLTGRDLVFEREIALRGVAFGYDEGAAIVDGLDLVIGKGEWIGLTGPTGGGKSTIGDLLLGLLAPRRGALILDGEELTAADLDGWQAQVAPVSQAVFVADMSIARNIVFADDGPTDEVRLGEAVRIARLGEWIGSLPGGLDSEVGEGGQRISGGQRQRIGIARALYKDASFLLLDEATNALDEDTEKAFLAALRASRPTCSVVIISHREAALAACDRIYRIEGGRAAAR